MFENKNMLFLTLSKNNHVEAINKFQKPNGVIYGNQFLFWQRFRILW